MQIVTSEYPPFEYSEGGRIVGSDTHVIRQVVEAMGYEPRIELLPWIRAEAKARRGEASMVYSLTYSDARAAFYHFTDPINQVQDMFFARQESDIAWQTLSDLDDLKIGVSASYSYAPEFMEWIEHHPDNVTRVSHEQPELTSLKMLVHRRIDLFICEQSVCGHLLNKHVVEEPELSRISAIPGIVGESRPFRAAFSRQNPEGQALRDAFNLALRELKQSSEHTSE
ncbi:substrate-binding periplasmic protein [Marinobacter sp.]